MKDSAAEVRLTHRVAGHQLRAGTGERDLAGLEHIGAVGDGKRRLRVLLHEQDGRARGVQLADDVEDLLDQNGREAHGRLVEHEKLGLAHERAAHREHLLLAAGECAGDLTAALLQTREALVNVRDTRLDGGIGLRVRAHLQILLHGHLLEDVASLGDLRQTVLNDLVRRDALEVMALKEDAAHLGVQQAGDRVQNGGFARAVRADERDDLALVDLKGNALDGVDAAVVHMDIINF